MHENGGADTCSTTRGFSTTLKYKHSSKDTAGACDASTKARYVKTVADSTCRRQCVNRDRESGCPFVEFLIANVTSQTSISLMRSHSHPQMDVQFVLGKYLSLPLVLSFSPTLSFSLLWVETLARDWRKDHDDVAIVYTVIMNRVVLSWSS